MKSHLIGPATNTIRIPIPRLPQPSAIGPRRFIRFFSTCPILFPWAELDRAVKQNLRFRRANLRRFLKIETEDDKDRLVQLDAMRLQARTWNLVTVLAVTSSADLVGVEVLGVRVAGNVLFRYGHGHK